jgi:hypothetical protein
MVLDALGKIAYVPERRQPEPARSAPRRRPYIRPGRRSGHLSLFDLAVRVLHLFDRVDDERSGWSLRSADPRSNSASASARARTLLPSIRDALARSGSQAMIVSVRSSAMSTSIASSTEPDRMCR